MLTSLAVPVYDMNGLGVDFLDFCLKSIFNQKINFNIEIIVSDQSKDENINNYIQSLKDNRIKYFKESNRGNHSCNTNNAIRNCSGDFIKILYQDDYLLNNNSLQTTIDNLINTDKSWLVSACDHSYDRINLVRPFYPQWNDEMLFGNNTFSCPSVVSIKKSVKHIMFDENLFFMPDVEYYYRMRNEFGDPFILNQITVVNTLHKNQTQVLSQDKYNKDLQYIYKKYLIKQ